MNEALERELEALRAEYRASLAPRLARLEALLEDTAGAGCAARFSELRREVHKIAGSAKTFGLPQVSEAAFALESYLQAHANPGFVPDPGERSELKLLLERLARAI